MAQNKMEVVVSGIFLSYRRDDSAGIAGRIYDRLVAHFGEDQIFMDVDSIPLGDDFPQILNDAVSRCDVLLAVIGSHWCGTGPDGGRRLDDPRDFVRIEVETALGRGIPVIPVLIGQTEMPSDEALPGSLKPLCMRNACSVGMGRDFHGHIDRLLRALESHVQAKPAPAPPATPPPRPPGKPNMHQLALRGDVAGIIDALENYDDYEILQRGISALGDFADSPEAVEMLIRLARRAHNVHRKTAIGTLGRIGGDKVIDALLPLLDDPDFTIRQAVIAVMGRCRARAAVPRLIQSLAERNDERGNAAQALEQIADEAALAALKERGVR